MKQRADKEKWQRRQRKDEKKHYSKPAKGTRVQRG